MKLHKNTYKSKRNRYNKNQVLKKQSKKKILNKMINKKQKRTGGGTVSNGLYTQLNANGLNYKFPIYYFGDTIQQIQTQDYNQNLNIDTKGWDKWLQNYIDTRNPNSQFGSLTLSQSMK